MKVTPSLLGLSLEVIALALLFALMLFEKATQTIFYISVAAIIVYLIVVYHFRLENPKKKHQDLKA